MAERYHMKPNREQSVITVTVGLRRREYYRLLAVDARKPVRQLVREAVAEYLEARNGSQGAQS